MGKIRNTCRLAADYLTVLAVYAHGSLAYVRAVHKEKIRQRPRRLHAPKNRTWLSRRLPRADRVLEHSSGGWEWSF